MVHGADKSNGASRHSVRFGENSYFVQCRAVQSYRHVALPESSGGKTRAEISPAEQYPASATIVAN